MSFLKKSEINKLGFKSIGDNCLISSKASFYNCESISIGSNVRIDDFCVLSAGEKGISIGNNIHIGVFSSLMGNELIAIKDFAGISARVSIFSSSDDYSGLTMSNPTIPNQFKNVYHAPVIIDKHVIIGSGSIILPGCHLHEGVAIGALSLVQKNIPAFTIYTGAPAKKIKDRSKNILELEQQYLNSIP